MTEFPENSTTPCFILQDQWFIYKKRYKLPAFLLNSQFNCMLYVAQVNKSENGYLAHVSWFKQSHYNTILKTYRNNQIIAISAATN